MYVDFHTHLLPGLDDGVQDWPEALALLQQAAADGVAALVLTPHFWPGVYQPEPARIDQQLAKLREQVNSAGLALELYAGVEAYITPDLPQLVKSGAVRSLAGTYLLVELPAHDYPEYVENVLFRLQTQGITPILAHPERNAYLAENREKLFLLAERGVFFQINAGSLTGLFGTRARRAAAFWLSAGLIHFLGSDAHSRHRPSVLSPAVAEITKIAGPSVAHLVAWENPRRALAGLPMAPTPNADQETASGVAVARAAEPDPRDPRTTGPGQPSNEPRGPAAEPRWQVAKTRQQAIESRGPAADTPPRVTEPRGEAADNPPRITEPRGEAAETPRLKADPRWQAPEQRPRAAVPRRQAAETPPRTTESRWPWWKTLFRRKRF